MFGAIVLGAVGVLDVGDFFFFFLNKTQKAVESRVL